MAKALMIDYERCVGCRTCEIACSIKHEGVINPSQGRIGIVKWEMEGKGIPITCAHCESAPCATICPIKAISRDESLGRVMIDYDRCIGCRMCVSVCPFGAVGFDSLGKRVIKCDVCDGDPLCVRFCVYGALQYVDVSEQSIRKQREAAERLKDVIASARHEIL
jgi:carbon-monoxide dehydrogenase iron sulfur subunit